MVRSSINIISTWAVLLTWLGLFSVTAGADALPAFRDIVKDNSDAVVNISVEAAPRNAPAAMHGLPPGMEGTPFEHFFRHFGPPGREGAPRQPRRGQGSGFIISEDGRILTNAHVVKGAERILVRLSDHRELEAKLVGLDEASDVALLKVDAKGLPTVRVGDSDDLVVGDWVLAIGSPFGLDYTATQGIVSAVGRSLPDETYVPFIQTDVAVNPGNSGGPLFNTRGEVVGINAQIYSRSGGYMGLSFAIPINTAMKVAAELADKGFVTRGWLGVTIQPVSQDLASAFGLERPRGALVADVTPDSPAARGGLQSGDVIVAFGGREVREADDLPPLVGETPVGAEVVVGIMREGREMQLPVTIAELQTGATVASATPGAGTLSKASLLNLQVEALDPRQRGAAGLGDRGVRVVRVGDGPAAAAGLRPGDLILQLGGRDVASPDDLARIVEALPEGRPASVLVQRQGRSLFLALQVPGGRETG